MSDFFAIFFGFLGPWNSENHAKAGVSLTKSRFRTFSKSEVPGPILGSLWEPFWSPLAANDVV